MKYLAVVILSFWAVLADTLTAHAQTVTPIYKFSGTDGANPYAGLTLGPDGNFYGTTYLGGSAGLGTVFKVTTNGTLTTLVNFNGTNGAYPQAGLNLGPDSNFYGTTTQGGSASGGDGTVFKVTTGGTLTTLVNFNNTNGSDPRAGLTLGPDGNFYGTTFYGGAYHAGNVFQVTTNGMLTTLASLNKASGDGPEADLTLGPDGNFYGTANIGGSNGLGTVFKMSTNGILMTLVSFIGANGDEPTASLTLGVDGNFYGTTSGGLSDSGSVFKMTANGMLTTLVHFGFQETNGFTPYAGLTLGPDGNFYGTTYYGGNGGGLGNGTVFKVTTNGTLTTLAYFSFKGTNGLNPYAGLTLGPDGNFYGTTYNGGNGVSGSYYGYGGNGTIFRLDLPPEFITAPTNQTVAIGSSATFGCQLFGTAPYGYQWLSNGLPVAGATNANLQFSPALTNDMANYQLVVTNSWGSITSQVASLNVLVQPNIYAISNSGAGNCTVYLANQPNSTNRLWASTNAALPFAQWQVIATNVMDANGLGQFLDTNTAGLPQKFYRLSYP